MCKKIWLGIDVGENELHVAIAPEGSDVRDWAKLANEAFANNGHGLRSLCAWVTRKGYGLEAIAGVCLESTGRLSRQLTVKMGNRLGPLSIVPPGRPKKFGESMGLRDKTDRVDACKLALFGAITKPTPKPLPPRLQRELREVSALRDRLVGDLLAEKNRLRAKPESKFVRNKIKAKIRAIKQDIADTEAEMERLFAQNEKRAEDVKRLQTIPGVGLATARAIVAQLGDLSEFKRNELVAYAGLYPKHFQSGKSVQRKPRLAKGGGASIRRTLHMAALSAKKHHPGLHTWAERKKAEGMAHNAILGAIMRRLLLIMRALVKNQKTYEPVPIST